MDTGTVPLSIFLKLDKGGQGDGSVVQKKRFVYKKEGSDLNENRY